MRITSFCVVLAAVAAAGCGGDGGYNSTPTPNPTPIPSGAVTINIVGQNGSQSFSPNPSSAGGQTVVFRNTDTIVHRVVLNDGTIDTGNIAPGATSAAVLMPGAGTNYHCSLHPAMVGAVNASDGGAPPACVGPYCAP